MQPTCIFRRVSCGKEAELFAGVYVYDLNETGEQRLCKSLWARFVP